jgi:hypothetical protein
MIAPKIATLLAIGLNLAAPCAALAQAEAPIAAGDRIRFAAPSLGSTGLATGTVLETKPDTLVVDHDGQAVLLPLAAVTSLDVSVGQSSRSGTGALIGLVGGAALTLGIATALDPGGTRPCPNFECLGDIKSEAAKALAIVVAGAVGGAIIGAEIGSAIKVEQWQQVPLDKVRLALSARADEGVGVAVSLHW